MTRATLILVWFAVVAVDVTAWLTLGAPIVVSTFVILLGASLVPPAIILMLWPGVQPPTAADILRD